MDRGGVVVRAEGEVGEEAALGQGRQGVGGALDGGCVGDRVPGRELAPDREEALGAAEVALVLGEAVHLVRGRVKRVVAKERGGR